MRFEKVQMADCISEIAMGPFGSNIRVECFVDKGVPVLNGSNLERVALSEESFRFVTEEKAHSLGKAVAHAGDVIVTHRGTLGQVAYIPKSCHYDAYVISQSQFRFRCNERLLPEYITYYFHGRVGQHKLLENASQVGVPALSRPTSTFAKIQIELPGIQDQRKIVEILRTLDDKIALNTQINRNLESMGRLIYDEMLRKDNPRIGTLGELAEITMGQSPRGDTYNEAGEGTIFFQGRAEFGDRYPSPRLFTTHPKRMAQRNFSPSSGWRY